MKTRNVISKFTEYKNSECLNNINIVHYINLELLLHREKIEFKFNVVIVNVIEQVLKLHHSPRMGFHTSDAIDFTNTNAIAAAALISSRDFVAPE